MPEMHSTQKTVQFFYNFYFEVDLKNDDERVVGRVWAAGLLVGVGSWAAGHFDSVVCVFAWRR